MTTIPRQDSSPDLKEDDKVSHNVQVEPVQLASQEHDPFEIDQTYLNASKSTKFFYSVLFQMILFSTLSFVGPSMSDAISNLGGGGLATPWMANLAQALSYGFSAIVAVFGGPLINKIGIKWSCVIAALAMPLAGSGYYTSARYKIDWYLLLSRAIGGICNAFLYIGETTAMLSYPHIHERGFYLGLWSAARNSGSVLGGAINFSTNYSNAQAGGIAWSTYLIFVGFECTGIIFALLLAKTSKVRRKDGSRIASSPPISWKGEFTALWKHCQHKRTWLIFVPAFYSFFYGGTMGTYLSLNFSVRARALSTLITPIVTIVMVMGYGNFVLDNKRFSQKTRAWMAFLAWAIPQGACFVWVLIMMAKFARDGSYAYDYQTDGAAWFAAWGPYLGIFTTGYLCQLSIYWILGTFSSNVSSASRTGGLFRGFETLGQTCSYAINATASSKTAGMYVNIAFFVLSLPCMIYLVRLVPDAPSENDDVADNEVKEAQAKAQMAAQAE